MANIANRSRFIVRVQNRDDLDRSVPYNQTKKVEQYVADLRGSGVQTAHRAGGRHRLRPHPAKRLPGAATHGRLARGSRSTRQSD
ncbi:hypothetical protein [Trinickia symbiotica]|uniref:hypothetical protein n=1 Tax=Trinickia symbiotica TaxID=863227 RepID=UPI0011B20E94|nr:hypothetical protein [Trinickia symbiotica]